MIRTEVATRAHADGLVALFERSGSPCFCRWWHFSGDKNAWLDRCANHADESRGELVEALESESDQARGVVAIDPAAGVIGWMKIAPAAAMVKVTEQRLYRGLPVLGGDRSATYVIGCFLIDEAVRGRGVAHALIERGLNLARERGARYVEAFPRRAEGVDGEALWTGPFSVFERAGFEVVHDFEPYPVMRCALAS